MRRAFKGLIGHEFVGQAVRFGLVGVANTGVGLGIIYACLFLLGWSDLAANLMGYTAGLLQSFLLNRRWTFRSPVPIAPAFLRFLVAFGISYAVNLALVLALRRADIPPALAHAAGMPVYTFLFFLLSRRLAFRPAVNSAVRTSRAKQTESIGLPLPAICPGEPIPSEQQESTQPTPPA